ncbi:uncharacterized protein FOMMEDRAFT_15955 [Fomitiporia mediterranea MF3/22]|uniref:uncharacterized protein n=1 Tax=Fomitiporia mediterranea (strain MF3/22) TaxID=694068 RepID=UPI0004408BD5|nr:uncharacterized protein FOMMEDRAFT_15955 [Fomitiporia mediterranea MF3/22]EJD07229.1 hypothetical protein FOMMEDRAFT_15955 [Fomitiporia mediterranea MF3/22]
MATNEHFLLTSLAKVVGTVDNLAYTVDEVIKNVKKERLFAKVNSGTCTDVLVTKALQKLDQNEHIVFGDVKGQPGFIVTDRGIDEIKRAMREYPTRTRRAAHSPYSFRAREVLRLGSFLKRKLLRNASDPVDETRGKYQERSGVGPVSIAPDESASISIPAVRVDDSIDRVVPRLSAFGRLPSQPSSSSVAPVPVDRPANTKVAPLPNGFLQQRPAFKDVLSESGSEADCDPNYAFNYKGDSSLSAFCRLSSPGVGPVCSESPYDEHRTVRPVRSSARREGESEDVDIPIVVRRKPSIDSQRTLVGSDDNEYDVARSISSCATWASRTGKKAYIEVAYSSYSLDQGQNHAQVLETISTSRPPSLPSAARCRSRSGGDKTNRRGSGDSDQTLVASEANPSRCHHHPYKQPERATTTSRLARVTRSQARTRTP